GRPRFDRFVVEARAARVTDSGRGEEPVANLQAAVARVLDDVVVGPGGGVAAVPRGQQGPELLGELFIYPAHLGGSRPVGQTTAPHDDHPFLTRRRKTGQRSPQEVTTGRRRGRARRLGPDDQRYHRKVVVRKHHQYRDGQSVIGADRVHRGDVETS